MPDDRELRGLEVLLNEPGADIIAACSPAPGSLRRIARTGAG
jgi:hypothetical protein